MPELLENMVEAIRGAARDLGCEAQLDDLAGLLADGGGAGIQRRACGGGDRAVEGVLDTLVVRPAPLSDAA